MIETTRGIFLHYLNYSDSAIIAKIYTEKFGIQSYIVNRPKSRKSGIKANLFQPLFLLELEAYHKEGKNIQRLKNARILSPFETLPFDIRKSSQAFFISEMLTKCLKEEEANTDLFNFIYHSVCLLDLKEDGISNFTISFLFRLSKYLGISPKEPENNNSKFFDLQAGSFKLNEPLHNHFMDADTSLKFKELFDCEMTNIENLTYKNKDRKDLINRIITYYQIHLDLTGEFKSLPILNEVFR